MTSPRDLDSDARRASFEATAVPLMAVLYNAARRLADGPDDAADLVQETYLRAYRTFDSFQAGTNCKAWLLTIMYSVFINEYRRRKRRGPTVSLDDLEQRFQHYLEVTSDAEVAAMTVAAWGARLSPEVDAALKQLTPEYRGPVVLIDLAGLSYDEAAGALQCPVGTVRSRLYRGRRALFAALQEYAAETGFFRGEG